MVFIDLPVEDVRVSREFGTALGFSAVMLLEHPRFRDFMTNDIADPRAVTQVLNCLSCESREEVDDLLQRALASGGTPWMPDQGRCTGRASPTPTGTSGSSCTWTCRSRGPSGPFRPSVGGCRIAP